MEEYVWRRAFNEQLAFSREAFKNGPTNSMAPWILTETHWGFYKAHKDPNYFKRPQVLDEMKDVYIELGI